MKTLISKRCLKSDEKLSCPGELVFDFPEAHDFIKKYANKMIVTRQDGRYKVRLYTEKYEYIVNFSKTDEGTYCSCYYNCRFQRPMEDWHRGNDLSDGHDVKHVLEMFEHDMLENELISFGDVGIEEPEQLPEEPGLGISQRSKWTVPDHHSFTAKESPINYLNLLLKKYFELVDGKE